ncbi:hydroxymethylglutaryl-CoA synthase family protein [Bradyrhizobium sp. USDA 4506]
MPVGIEAISSYAGCAYVDIEELFVHRGLNVARMQNLMMSRKSIQLPFEDAITNGVNAAWPILEQLSPTERSSINLVIAATESGVDFGKSISSYIHAALELSSECRYFEVKQACYGGTAGLQMAINAIAADPSPTSKALVIATDAARPQEKASYAEPTQGTGAVALLVSRSPKVMTFDCGASGYCSYEVMDAFRPTAEIETGDPDLSLMSYMDCLTRSVSSYGRKVPDCDYRRSFDSLVFHTPYAGMVAACHRTLMRALYRCEMNTIADDFGRRVRPSVEYAIQVGNTYSASLYMALLSLLENSPTSGPHRVGMFSYGSGCSSEFFSGTLTIPDRDSSRPRLGALIESRHKFSMQQYDEVLKDCRGLRFGSENVDVPDKGYIDMFRSGTPRPRRLRLASVRNFHRKYTWD